MAKRRAKTRECKWKDWQSCVGANLLMSFLCPFASIREAEPLLIRRRRRRIHHQRRREEATSLRDNLSGTTASSKINKYKRLNRAGSGCARRVGVSTRPQVLIGFRQLQRDPGSDWRGRCASLTDSHQTRRKHSKKGTTVHFVCKFVSICIFFNSETIVFISL